MQELLLFFGARKRGLRQALALGGDFQPLFRPVVGRLALAQGNRQRRGIKFANWRLVVIRRPLQEPAAALIEDRLAVDALQRRLELCQRGFRHQVHQYRHQAAVAKGHPEALPRAQVIDAQAFRWQVIKQAAQRNGYGQAQNYSLTCSLRKFRA